MEEIVSLRPRNNSSASPNAEFNHPQENNAETMISNDKFAHIGTAAESGERECGWCERGRAQERVWRESVECSL
jgi:hypothetical protein